MNSAWYVGQVSHTRHAPVAHHFDYSMMMGLFDLDELHRLDAEVRGFGMDRRSPVGFHTADHGPAEGTALRPWAAERLTDAGLDPTGATGPIQLMCMPRTFGFGFDPITVWFLHDGDGAPSALIHEVRNTFGHRHAYVAPIGDPDRPLWRQRADKTLHVSPFFDRDGTYDFTVNRPRPSPAPRHRSASTTQATTGRCSRRRSRASVARSPPPGCSAPWPTARRWPRRPSPVFTLRR